MEPNETPHGIAPLLLHAGYMSGAEYPHLLYERDRLMREQRERDEHERDSAMLQAYFTLGLR